MCHRADVGRLLILALAVGVSWCGMLPAWEVEDPQTTTSGSLRIQVVDAEGKPVPKARIHLGIWTSEDFKEKKDTTCDEQGTAVLALPKTLRIIRVWATAKGYAGMFAQLWPQTPAEKPLPEQFTFKLVKGTTMSGVVKNDEGQPIKGARVEARYRSGGVGDDTCPPAQFDSSIAYGILGRLTDAEGRWKLDNVPPGDKVEVQLKVTHREYLNDEDYGSLQTAQHVTRDQLRDGSATIVMHRGTTVTGRIADGDGKPVSNAVVIWGDRPYWDEGPQEVRTDKDGVYRTPPLASGSTRLTIVAPQWMPQTKKIDVTPGMQPVDFQLARGKKLRLKFVDAKGAPVPEVYVSIDKWRGVESLYNHKHSNVIDVQIPRTSDKDGIYEWTWAPDDAVDYRFGKEGFADNEASIAADDQEHVITVHGAFEIAGTVADSATGKPLDDFRVVPIIHFSPDFAFLPRRESQAFTGAGGKFRMAFDRADIEHGVQIEAAGYRPFRTDRRYKLGDANLNLDIKLQPTEHQVGSVVDGNGQPVADAKVYVASWYQHLDLNTLDGREEDFSSNYLVNTDAQGRFEIVPQFERYKLVVVTPTGYAEAERSAEDKPGELRVLPWAKLSGRVLQDGKPMPDALVYWTPIQLRGGEEPRVDLRLGATTTADGSFAFDRIPPGKSQVRPYLHFSAESPLKSSRSMPLDVAPGEERAVELGGGGVEVTGRLVLDKPRDPFDFHFSLTYLVAKRAGVDPPQTLAAKGFDWRNGWSDAWRNSQEGGAYLNTLHNWFVKPDSDGHIRISGVEPGDYELAVSLYGTTEGCLVHPQALRVVPITVRAGEPALDLGDVVIPTNPVPAVGDAAANFKVQSPDGKSVDFASLRGRYVLIDFWATWCRPCVATLPEVDALGKQFGDKLAVVGANLDSEKERAGEFLKERPLRWHHALLGDWSSTDLPKRYGISTVPAYVLVDPEGKIAAIEYSVEKVAAMLESRVKQP